MDIFMCFAVQRWWHLKSTKNQAYWYTLYMYIGNIYNVSFLRIWFQGSKFLAFVSTNMYSTTINHWIKTVPDMIVGNLRLFSNCTWQNGTRGKSSPPGQCSLFFLKKLYPKAESNINLIWKVFTKVSPLLHSSLIFRPLRPIVMSLYCRVSVVVGLL